MRGAATTGGSRADTPPITNWKDFLLDHAMFDSTGRIIDKKIDET